MFAFHLTNRLQANLIKETPICLLNRAMFNSRKICVVNLEKGAEKKFDVGEFANEIPLYLDGY